MRRLVFLPTAEQDLGDIYLEIAVGSTSVAVADGFIARLRRRCDRIAGLPGTLGSARPELRPDVRSVSEQGYVIFFRYLPGRVEIVRIMEGHRDVAAQFDPPQSH